MSGELSIAEAERTFEVAFVGRLKHAALRRASERLGSQSALAEALGLSPTTVGMWCNLKAYPAFSDELDGKLVLVVGKSWYELWPPDLRYQLDNHAGRLSGVRTLYQQMRGAELLKKREATATAGLENLARAELREKLGQVLKCLSYREREIIKLRFGLDGHAGYTYDELTHVFKVTRERIRQIEAKALAKLQQPSRAGQIVGLLPPLDGQEVEDQRPRDESLKDKVQRREELRQLEAFRKHAKQFVEEPQ